MRPHPSALVLTLEGFSLVELGDPLLILRGAQHLRIVLNVVFEGGLVPGEHRVKEVLPFLFFVAYARCVHERVLQEAGHLDRGGHRVLGLSVVLGWLHDLSLLGGTLFAYDY